VIAWTGEEQDGRGPLLELHVTRRPVLTGGVLQLGRLGELREKRKRAQTTYRRYPSHGTEIELLKAMKALEEEIRRNENTPCRREEPNTGCGRARGPLEDRG
jgi:hypothetical protein